MTHKEKGGKRKRQILKKGERKTKKDERKTNLLKGEKKIERKRRVYKK